jgi:para-nitrobenzyl esterase
VPRPADERHLHARDSAVGTLLGAGLLRGLVTRAISMSGGAETVYEPTAATAVAQTFLAGVGAPDHRLKTLQEIPASDLLAGQIALGGGVETIWHWRPVIDGVTLLGSPVAAIRAGAAAGVPMLIGSNQR